MKNFLVNDLLEVIYNYYPIGLPGVKAHYKGEKEIRRIIESKVNKIISGEKTAWSELIKVLERKYESNLFDMGYQQFPSYIGSIEIFKNQYGIIEHTRKITFSISLLCQFYTIFYEDSFDINYDNDKLDRQSFRILFKEKDKVEQEHFEYLKENIEANFQAYKLLNHKLLFDYNIIGGVPYSHSFESADQKNPLYVFLFDSNIHTHNLTIVD